MSSDLRAARHELPVTSVGLPGAPLSWIVSDEIRSEETQGDRSRLAGEPLRRLAGGLLTGVKFLRRLHRLCVDLCQIGPHFLRPYCRLDG